jgi:16S rRNA (cytidine1402-2'-O)-methyltransferase
MELGVLYVVATPIGNLSDISLRALEVLKTCDLIISEDTRETQKLLNHYKIAKSQVSYRDQNHKAVFLKILNELLHDKVVCLVCDSGTPLISDPGFKLINELRRNGFNNIKSVPGPSALVSALSISGLPTDQFTFLGFLPKKEQDIVKLLEPHILSEGTTIFYESPLRVVSVLNLILKLFGNRAVSVCSEITKSHESVHTGYISDIIKCFENTSPRGEYVILVAKVGFTYDNY